MSKNSFVESNYELIRRLKKKISKIEKRLRYLEKKWGQKNETN